MEHSASGRIFVYDDNRTELMALRNVLESHNLEMFGTDNVYQLLQYADEINPDVMVFDIADDYTPATATLKHFGQEIHPERYPIIVLKPQQFPFNQYSSIAHYLHTPLDMRKFIDILESYGNGGKQHDILLLDSYSETKGNFHQELERHNISYFEVHNADAARIYLEKNTPQIVCIEYKLPYISARHSLYHPQIFYVDRHQDLTEIKNFLH